MRCSCETRTRCQSSATFEEPMRLQIRIMLVALGFSTAQLLTPSAGRPSQALTLKDVAWLAGCWERRTPETTVSEQWMQPQGGLMPGMSRTVRNGKAVEFEFLRIFER